MTDREKLIELLGGDMCKDCCCYDCEYENDDRGCIEHIKQNMADHLLANGVRLEPEQATSDENKRWIPVSERLPDENQVVLCMRRNGSYWVAQWTYIDWMWYDENEWRTEKEVTHWMPLPAEPPKEDV